MKFIKDISNIIISQNNQCKFNIRAEKIAINEQILNIKKKSLVDLDR